MRGRTDTKYNRFSSANEERLRRWLQGLVVVLAGVCVMFGSVAPTRAGEVLGGPVNLSDDNDEWSEGLLFWLLLWSDYMQVNPPFGDEPRAWLEDFNSTYARRGLPDGLTESTRREMLATLDSLSAHLESNPGVIDQQLFNRTVGTIDKARQELSAPIPVPPPPGVAAPDHEEGRRA